ncbi:hypothetical protein BDN72DRAFT_828976 [Pluteus cervinus]|uniref:Uncharacterized protein n=1 Tax=Pluteus cervinus TaxID=181527 RepID=A0ACD3A3U8_9AGAR|nr:hypothetical protein BDN72DRAFT_828976 [Pluteus cervinus]
MERTLVDIIRSCLFTIAACVYRAIHQNIPDPEATWWQRQWLKTKITLLALLAPEMMIWWAMKQWMGAKVIKDRLNLLFYRHNIWTLTHGHFLQMGGLIRKDNHHVLNPDNLVDLFIKKQIHLDSFRRISQKEIEDHSKGDALSKAVVAVQTTWFVLECLVRLQQNLRLTELEVATLAFAVLNMFTYGFWWHKPLNVLCPIAVDFEPTGTGQEPESIPNPLNLTWRIFFRNQLAQKIYPTARLSTLLNTWKNLRMKEAVSKWWADLMRDIRSDGFWDVISERLIEAYFGAIVERLQGILTVSFHSNALHVPTFYASKIPDRKRELVLYLASLIGMIFGAIHLLSWNSPFHTQTEATLWRISSVILVVQPFLVALTWTLRGIVRRAELRWAQSPIQFLGLGCLVFSSSIGPAAYVLARFCILALAFLTLRTLLPDAFQNITWTTYIPHL